MRRLFPVLLAIILLCGCGSTGPNRYENSLFSVSLPDGFEPIDDVPILCFAPYGDPLLSSSVTVITTELNWYFDDFSEDEYVRAIQSISGFEAIDVKQIDLLKVDGYPARRIACSVQIDQGTHDLILYAISADRTYFFTLLNRHGDDYVASFDSMIQTIRFTEGT